MNVDMVILSAIQIKCTVFSMPILASIQTQRHVFRVQIKLIGFSMAIRNAIQTK